MPEDVVQRVEDYRPQRLNQAEWKAWGPSIKHVVHIVRPDRTQDAARIVTLLAVFAADLISWGHEPPVAQHVILSRIERHVANNSSVGSMRTRRTELIRLGRVLNPEYLWPSQSQPIARSKRKPPYSPGELDSLLRAAESQEGEADCRLFQVSLALGLHGLDGRVVPYMGRDGVVIRESGVFIGGDEIRPEMLVRGRLGEWLAYWHQRTEPGQLLVGSPSRFNSQLSALRADDGKTRLQMARLRTNYVVRLLEHRGLLQSEILQLAGLRSTSSLDEYRCYVSEADAETASKMHSQLPLILPDWGI